MSYEGHGAEEVGQGGGGKKAKGDQRSGEKEERRNASDTNGGVGLELVLGRWSRK